MTYDPKKLTFASAVAALLLSTAANAQMFGDEIGTDYGAEEFNAGLGESGMYDAWDSDEQAGLSENEFATGVFSDWDRDNDLALTEEEYTTGSERWYGEDNEANFIEYDADQSGVIEREEFRSTWDNERFGEWDADQDEVLSEDEFGTGLYSRADANQDMVISVEEEGWFEGWFDGDDVEAEIEQTGDVLGES